MPSMGGGRFGSSARGKTIQLADSDGTSSFTIIDVDGFPIFRIDSKGNVYTRRALKRI